jgi:integral membrane sensor domain MASE1
LLAELTVWPLALRCSSLGEVASALPLVLQPMLPLLLLTFNARPFLGLLAGCWSL